MSEWLYKGRLLEDSDFPETTAGFLYLIRHTISGRKYIGRKLITKAHRRQKNKKIIRSRVESDWRVYWSSSPEILKMITEEGTDNFVREVLMFAPNKSILNYLEEKFLYSVGSMEKDIWFNSNIRAKVFKRNVKGKIDTDEMNAVLLSVN